MKRKVRDVSAVAPGSEMTRVVQNRPRLRSPRSAAAGAAREDQPGPLRRPPGRAESRSARTRRHGARRSIDSARCQPRPRLRPQPARIPSRDRELQVRRRAAAGLPASGLATIIRKPAVNPGPSADSGWRPGQRGRGVRSSTNSTVGRRHVAEVAQHLARDGRCAPGARAERFLRARPAPWRRRDDRRSPSRSGGPGRCAPGSRSSAGSKSSRTKVGISRENSTPRPSSSTRQPMTSREPGQVCSAGGAEVGSAPCASIQRSGGAIAKQRGGDHIAPSTGRRSGR